MNNETKTTTENNKLTVINGGVTDKTIAGWKAKHGRICEVEVDCEDFGERHVGYFRRPDMKTMQAVSATSKNNEVKAAEVMFDNCWLGGSDELKNDALMKMEAIGALQNIFGRCVSRLKNL